MPTIYNKGMTEEEAKEFVYDYYKKNLAYKKGCYHQNTALFKGEKLNILDFGCGFYSIELSERGHRVTAIDYPNEIEICKLAWGDIDNVTFSTQKIYNLPDDYFDLVISSQVIEHVHNLGNYLR